MLVDALQPFCDIAEGGCISHIESYDDTVCLLVEGVGDCTESLLACCIPYFDCNVFAFGRVVLGRHVVKADGRHVTLTELLVLVHLQQGGLAYSAVSQDNYLDFLLRHVDLLIDS